MKRVNAGFNKREAKASFLLEIQMITSEETKALSKAWLQYLYRHRNWRSINLRCEIERVELHCKVFDQKFQLWDTGKLKLRLPCSVIENEAYQLHGFASAFSGFDVMFIKTLLEKCRTNLHFEYK